jgi:hypothetical protein
MIKIKKCISNKKYEWNTLIEKGENGTLFNKHDLMK